MRSRSLQVAVVLLAFVTPGVSPQLEQQMQRVENGLLPATVVQGEAPLRMKLSDRMKFYRVPGVSIAVINNGKLEWARGYGYRSAGSQQPVTTDTIFQAASISKPFTAIAVLRLVEQGKLALDDDVNKYLTTWKVPDGDVTKNDGRTIRRALSHSAGFTVSGFLGYSSDQPLPTLLQILDGKPPANSSPIRVDLAPGTKYRYSGGGYVVLQQLLIDVTKTSFAELMQPIFRTLRMRHSSFESPALSGNAASGHLPDGKAIAGGWYKYPELAAAGLWTTPTDLAQLVVELQKSANGKIEAFAFSGYSGANADATD